MIPAGVQGTNTGLSHRQPADADRMKPIDVLRRIHCFDDCCLINLARQGSCVRMPSTSSRAFNDAIKSSNCAVVVDSGNA